MKYACMFVLVALFALVGNAHAALDLTGVSVDTTDYVTIAEFIIGALVAFWGIRRGLSLLRS